MSKRGKKGQTNDSNSTADENETSNTMDDNTRNDELNDTDNGNGNGKTKMKTKAKENDEIIDSKSKTAKQQTKQQLKQQSKQGKQAKQGKNSGKQQKNGAKTAKQTKKDSKVNNVTNGNSGNGGTSVGNNIVNSSNLKGQELGNENRKFECGKKGNFGKGFPRRYDVICYARVRTQESVESPHITDLPEGSIVLVAEIKNRRARIIEPINGWLSVVTKYGGKIIIPADRNYALIGAKIQWVDQNDKSCWKGKIVDFDESSKQHTVMCDAHYGGRSFQVNLNRFPHVLEDPSYLNDSHFNGPHARSKTHTLSIDAPHFDPNRTETAKLFDETFSKDYPGLKPGKIPYLHPGAPLITTAKLSDNSKLGNAHLAPSPELEIIEQATSSPYHSHRGMGHVGHVGHVGHAVADERYRQQMMLRQQQQHQQQQQQHHHQQQQAQMHGMYAGYPPQAAQQQGVGVGDARSRVRGNAPGAPDQSQHHGQHGTTATQHQQSQVQGHTAHGSHQQQQGAIGHTTHGSGTGAAAAAAAAADAQQQQQRRMVHGGVRYDGHGGHHYDYQAAQMAAAAAQANQRGHAGGVGATGATNESGQAQMQHQLTEKQLLQQKRTEEYHKRKIAEIMESLPADFIDQIKRKLESRSVFPGSPDYEKYLEKAKMKQAKYIWYHKLLKQKKKEKERERALQQQAAAAAGGAVGATGAITGANGTPQDSQSKHGQHGSYRTIDDIPNPYRLPSVMDELKKSAERYKQAKSMIHALPKEYGEKYTEEQWHEYCRQHYTKKYNAALWRIKMIRELQARQQAAQAQLQAAQAQAAHHGQAPPPTGAAAAVAATAAAQGHLAGHGQSGDYPYHANGTGNHSSTHDAPGGTQGASSISGNVSNRQSGKDLQAQLTSKNAGASHDRYSKGLMVLRGLPGSGKTTLAKKLAKRSHDAKICTEDKYHWSGREDGVGEYKFQPNLVFQARDWCTAEIRRAIEDGVHLVILDNHNARISMYEEHIQFAVQHGYRFRIIEFIASEEHIDKYRARSYKKFPREVYSKLLRLWEFDPRAELINPTFSEDNNNNTGDSKHVSGKSGNGANDNTNNNNNNNNGTDKNGGSNQGASSNFSRHPPRAPDSYY